MIILYSTVGRETSGRLASVLMLPGGAEAVGFPPAFLFKARLVVVDLRNTQKAGASAERRARRPAISRVGTEDQNISSCFTLHQE